MNTCFPQNWETDKDAAGSSRQEKKHVQLGKPIIKISVFIDNVVKKKSQRNPFKKLLKLISEASAHMINKPRVMFLLINNEELLT